MAKIEDELQSACLMIVYVVFSKADVVSIPVRPTMQRGFTIAPYGRVRSFIAVIYGSSKYTRVVVAYTNRRSVQLFTKKHYK